MESLKTRFPELKLTLVGDGDLRQPLQQEAVNRGIQAEFVGTETAAQIRERLARCWVFAAPSITAESGDAEGLGMVFLEAQALNTPVVSFHSGGVTEAVDDGISGLLCREKDVTSFTENVAELLDNPALRQNMGAAGRKRIESEFDVRQQCAKLENIYNELS